MDTNRDDLLRVTKCARSAEMRVEALIQNIATGLCENCMSPLADATEMWVRYTRIHVGTDGEDVREESYCRDCIGIVRANKGRRAPEMERE